MLVGAARELANGDRRAGQIFSAASTEEGPDAADALLEELVLEVDEDARIKEQHGAFEVSGGGSAGRA